MKDLGPLHHFLGISVSRTPTSLHLSQQQYILELLSRAGMSDYDPVSTPVDTQAKLYYFWFSSFLILLYIVVLRVLFSTPLPLDLT